MSGKEVISEVVVRALDGAKDQPDMRAAGRALGTSARILAETVRTALLPLAVVNLGVRKFEDYLRGKFADELDEATASIPGDSLREPPLNVAGPAMQGLAFAYESEQLRRMFLALLATSMDTTRDGQAHPAFAQILGQLDGLEAALLTEVLRRGDGVDVVRYHKRSEAGPGQALLLEHVLPILTDTDHGRAPGYEKVSAWVDNWVRLGLIEVDYRFPFAAPDRYLWVEDWPSTVGIRREIGEALVIEQGALTATTWGRSFALAINADAHTNGLFKFATDTESDPSESEVDTSTDTEPGVP